MASKPLDIDELLLDLQNPRISKASSQREALQKIIEDQDVKLVVLAESIVTDGLNPMDRWLVLKSADERGKYIVLEGNRRLATIRLLHNPALMNDLEVRAPVKKRLEDLAKQFAVKSIEPIDCFEIDDRADAATWLTQRHTGENQGSGIVNWGGMATARFRGRDPALQALDLVTTYGSLSDEEKGAIESWFPISTLDRLLSTPAVRAKFGVDIADSKLKTDLSAAEVIKPLRRVVLELATEAVNVSQLKSKEQMVAYVTKLGKDLPNLAKRTGKMKPVDELGERDFKPVPKPKPRPKPAPVRKTLIPRDCYLTVTNAKIAEITKELRTLLLSEYPHSISVLFRVFLEQSVDHHLTAAGIPLTVTMGRRQQDKNLRQKVSEAIAEMVKKGVPKKNLDGVSKGINDKHSPLFTGTLHNYVHNRFYSPQERELKVAWDNAQLFFEHIWHP
ncbi:MAG: hypothetical protein FJ311_07820 [Rhodospirillales bacterium]|nr:hypothetical protein [Rhodospirillales bacterium]